MNISSLRVKIILFFIVFICVFSNFWNTNAINQVNTQNNIDKAILIEDYIKRHKANIENFIIKYDLEKNESLKKEISILNESIKALEKIKNHKVEKEKADEVISGVLNTIKNTNESLKTKLKIEKNIFEKKLKQKQELYVKIWIKIASKIDNINLKIAQNIFKDKEVLSMKESKIRESLIKLNKESKKLKNFWSFQFNSENEIKDSFIRILKNIKREVNFMKSTIK